MCAKIRQPSQRIQFRSVASGFTLIELLIVVAIIGIVAAVAVPGMLRARASANGASAVGSLRAVSSAQATYAGSAATGGYASLLATLGTPCPGSSTTFLSMDLSSDPSVKSGYVVTLASGTAAVPRDPDCNGTPTSSAFYVTAAPVSSSATGSRAFATTSAGSIYVGADGVPPTEAEIEARTAATIQ